MFVCMRPGIAMEIGFKNWNRCRMSGLPVDTTCIRIVDFNISLYKTKVLSTIELLGDN